VSARHPSQTYRPAWWIPGPHAQTLWGKFFRRAPQLGARVERWPTPDGDFLELHRVATEAAGQPRLLLLHGLEGTVRSHYVGGFFAQAAQRGWDCDLLLFRGCGTEPNRAPRFYHSGETTDLDFVVSRLIAQNPEQPLLIAGVSLGGNVLLKWLGELGPRVPRQLAGAAAMSVPYDLERGSRYLATGVRRIYDRHFLRTLRQKAFEKLGRYPELFDASALRAARSIYEFDDAVTAPVHGFANARDYYARSSAIRWLDRIRLPTLLLSAMDDPFLPPGVLGEVRDLARANDCLTVDFPARGGHVGFIAGRWPWRIASYGEWRTCEFLAALV
jgi:predicted alpha/beta-fold hydrolase